MQQHARPAWPQYNFHFSSRSLTGIELQNCLARSFSGEVFGILITKKEIQSNSAASAATTSAREAVFIFRDAGNVHASQRLRVFGKRAIRFNDQNIAQLITVTEADFLNSWIIRSSSLVGSHHHFDLGGNFGVHRG